MWTFTAKNALKKQKKTDKVYQSFSFIMAIRYSKYTLKLNRLIVAPPKVKRLIIAPPYIIE